MPLSFQEAVLEIVKKDARYDPDAYFFLVEALDATVKDIRKNQPDHDRHVTGKELLAGIKEYALDEFGPMTFTVFAEWGIHATEDFGELVFNLVEAERLGKTDSDSRADFKDAFSFAEAFVRPFEPQLPKTRTRRAPGRRKRE
ncbi:MAG: hypothetical protein LBW77_01510 [Verrucomicrobiota bacterium]|jgi:uncharacterized repeat protein (TIGR04138 family)|nr:hypothetical protein [Verrucomicrobiota bacterium]